MAASFELVLLVLSAAAALVSGNVQIVRGVDIKHQAFYDPNQQFTCLDGSKTIPFSSVNDDYCDCPDSSDEPGTSACPEGKFHCANIGFRSQYLQSSRVNDGICDCCDGSDEYDSRVACFNECLKQGEEDRLKRQEDLAEANTGFNIKLDYIQRGQDTKSEKQAKADSIKSVLEDRRAKLEELRVTKEAAEGPEKEAKDQHKKEFDEIQAQRKEEQETLERVEAFGLLDTDKNRWIDMGELMSNQHLDSDLSESESKDLIGGEGMVSAEGFAIVWDMIKSRFVKDGRKAQEEVTGENAEDKQEVTGEGTDGAINEEEPPPEGGEDEMPPIETRPSTEEDDDVDDEEDDEDDDGGDESGDNEDYVLPVGRSDESLPDYPEETKKLIEVADAAREEFEKVEREVREFETEHKDLETHLSLDLGKEHEFAPLKGECYEYTDREYTYKLCPFEKVTQRNKDGGSETDLGRWGKWVQDGDYKRMKYENGQGCWNGPSRSTVVQISCGKENRVLSVSEPSRCEYEMEFKTPALCYKVDHAQHNEL